MMGFANLTFAGGRDTIIHSISGVIAHLAETPDALDFLTEDPKRIQLASEEYFRALSPITHLGRVCPVETDVHGHKVPADGRISLNWASANHDESVFDDPHKIQLDRKPTPHIAFGGGTHICLGAPHARLIVRTLLQKLVDQVKQITLVESTPLIEDEATYTRANGYESLTVRFTGR
jgi:cytochrome P450